MSQTSYSIDIPAVSFPGQIADNGSVKDVISAINVASAIGYGLVVVHDLVNGSGFDNLACKLPSASADITAVGSALGVVLADQARAQDPSFADPTYPIKSALPIMRQGRVWVISETDVVDGAPVFVRFDDSLAGKKGAVRKDADTATAVALPGAVFRGSYATAGYVVVELNLA